jgi:hypothetical protein
MHVKSYLFSRTGGRERVTMYSSSNLVPNHAERIYNDAYQTVGHPDVYRHSRVFFDLLRFDRGTDVPGRKKVAGHWLGWTPDPDTPKDNDYFSKLLDATDCRGQGGPTQVRVAASIWYKSKLDAARKVAGLNRRGCDVQVLFNTDWVSPEVMDFLLDRGVPTRVQSLRRGEDANHSKFIAIKGSHYGKQVSTVYSGSLNLSTYSIRRSDNNMVRIVDNDTTFTAYRKRFERVWENSRRLTERDVSQAQNVRVRQAEAAD